MNPKIDFARTPFRVACEPSDWPRGSAPRRAGLSSFGAGGANVHLILEEFVGPVPEPDTGESVLLVVSERNEVRLRTAADQLRLALEGEVRLRDIAFTLLQGREAMAERLALVVADKEEARARLSRFLSGEIVGLLRGKAKSESGEVAKAVVIHANEPGCPATRARLEEIAAQWVAGVKVEWGTPPAGMRPRRVSLPLDPFERRRYWVPGPEPRAEASGATTLLFEPVWVPAEMSDGGSRQAEGLTDVLVWGGSTDWFEAVAKSLGVRAKVQRLESAEEMEIPAVVGGDVTPHRLALVHWWCGSSDPVEDFAAFFRKVRALVNRDRGAEVLLLVLGPDAGESGSAALGAFGATLQIERPAFRFRTIRCDNREPSRLAALLPGELQRWQEGETNIRYVGGRRLVRRLQAAPAPKAVPVFRKEGCYLITGGAGALALECASWLARNHQGRIMLAGRSPLRAELAQKLRLWEQGGAGVQYVQADVSDPAGAALAVAAARERWGVVHGLIHCAGVKEDQFILRKEEASVRRVVAPKVVGVVGLDGELGTAPLDFFLVFSSTSAVWGNEGQADYAYANAFMDEFVRDRERLREAGLRFGRSLSINWPLWSGGGMAIDEARRHWLRAELGVEELPVAKGLEAMETALAMRGTQIVVMHGDAAKLDAWIQPVRALPAESQPPPAVGSEARDRCLAWLLTAFSEASKVPRADLDPDEPLERYGIDSILIQALNRRLTSAFGNISKTLFFEHQSLAALADHLAASLPERVVALGTGNPAAVIASRGEAEVIEPAQSAQSVQRATDLIAIIGLAGRYPQAPDLRSFWRNLADGRDCIAEIPPERWDWRAFFEADPKAGRRGKSYSRWGGFLADVDAFDPLFFNIAPREAELMDPQERLFLETAWVTLEDAGYTPRLLNECARRLGGEVGVFVGVTKLSYLLHGPALWASGNPALPGTAPWSIANRVSYLFDFHGPSLPVDTACSASLTAVHEAVQHIRRGDCAVALVGGVNLYLHPATYVGLCAAEMLSADGRCRSFGRGGDGFVPGEGVGAMLLKPLRAAERDGDFIYAVLRGSAVNHGGKTNGFTVPNPKAQAAVVAAALHDAGVEARSVSYVEAHGTGTALGDPVEVSGLTAAFRRQTSNCGFCALGSVKSNIGHLEAAAGIAGVTKVVLQMQQRRLVQTLHASPPNPDIDFAATPFVLQQAPAGWSKPSKGFEEWPRRAGVSSFGAGGANAHVLLEEYEDRRAATAGRGPVLLVISAKNEERRREMAERLLAFLRTLPGELEAMLGRIAWTLQTGRQEMESRAAFLARDGADACAKLEAWLEAPGPADGIFQGDTRQDRGRAPAGGSPAHFTTDLALIAARWVTGETVHWSALYPEGAPLRLPLPTYPFAREHYWLPKPETSAAAEASPASLYYKEAWQPAPASMDPSVAARPARWLLFNLSPDLSAVLARRCGRDHVTVVRFAERFERNSGDEFCLRKEVRSDFDQLAAALTHELAPGWQVVFQLPPSEEQLWGAESAAIVRSLLHVIQLFGGGNADAGGRMMLLAQGGRQDASPVRAAAVGLLKEWVAEGSRRVGRLVLHDGVEAPPIAEMVLQESSLATGFGHEVCWLGGERWARVMVPATAAGTAIGLRENGVYLLTGGGGGLGMIFAKHLMVAARGRVALLGRSAPAPARLDALRREAGGAGEVMFVAGDVSCRTELVAAIAAVKRRWGAIHGVIHAAGTLENGRLSRCGAEVLDRVCAAKTHGAALLDELTAAEPLDWFVLFSSIAAILGSFEAPGYGAANAALAGLARWRERKGQEGQRRGRTVAMLWPQWEGGGMRPAQDAMGVAWTRWLRDAQGIVPTNATTGWTDFLAALSSGGAVVLPISGYAGKVETTLRAGMGLVPPAAQSIPTGSSAAPSGTIGLENIPTRVREEVVSDVVELLKLPSHRLDLEAPLSEFGFDSIGLKAFAERLNRRYGLDLTPGVCFAHPTLNALSRHLEKLLASRPERLTKPEAPAPWLATETAAAEPIAIVGMDGILPGSRDLDEFWHHLVNGDDLVGEVPQGRWADAPDLNSEWRGGFIADVARFDAQFFGLSRREAELMDPQHRLFLQTAWRAIESAGIAPKSL
ncbi:MAG: SDR family NAD(P)-dependent oxidoreductase, partial [Terriglobales bacterium]